MAVWAGSGDPRVALVIRPGASEDWPWIAQTWAESIRGGGREQRKVPSDVWSKHWYGLIGRVLATPGVVVLVTATEDDQGLPAYLVAEPRHGAHVLHMVYVRKDCRRRGLAKELLARYGARTWALTCWTQDVSNWALEKSGMKYVPLSMLYPERTHGEADRVAGVAQR